MLLPTQPASSRTVKTDRTRRIGSSLGVMGDLPCRGRIWGETRLILIGVAALPLFVTFFDAA